VPAALGVAAVALPVGLASATVRSASVYSTSTLTAAGVSPVVVGLTNGVVRMFWMKKLMTAVVVMVLAVGAGVLVLGTANRPESAAHATEPLTPGAPPAPEDPEDAAKRIEKRLADLEKQRTELDKAVAEAAAEKAKLAAAMKEKEAAAALGTDLMLVVGRGDDKKPRYTLREVVAGKIGELAASDLDVVATYLARAHQDPKGPKKLRIQIDRADQDHKDKVFAACAAAGYTKVSLSERVTVIYTMPVRVESPVSRQVQRIEIREVDLTKYADPKKP
jgi:hypothetical protein